MQTDPISNVLTAKGGLQCSSFTLRNASLINLLPPNIYPSERYQTCDTSQYGDYGEYVETDAKGTFALRVRGESAEHGYYIL